MIPAAIADLLVAAGLLCVLAATAAQRVCEIRESTAGAGDRPLVVNAAAAVVTWYGVLRAFGARLLQTRFGTQVGRALVAATPFIAAVGGWLWKGWWEGLGVALIVGAPTAWFGLVRPADAPRWALVRFTPAVYLVQIAGWFLAGFVWVSAALRLDPLVLGAILVLAPGYVAVTSLPMAYAAASARRFGIRWFIADPPLAFSVGLVLSASFAMTGLGLAIGHYIDSVAPVPATVQMLAANLVFDWLTLVVSLLLLRWAAATASPRAVLLAVVCDLVAAALMAMASLWLGLLGGVQELDPPGVAWVLLARSVDGLQWHLGPYFWVMHTAFVPTLLFFLLLMGVVGADFVAWPFKLLVQWELTPELDPYSTAVWTLQLAGAVLALVGLAARVLAGR